MLAAAVCAQQHVCNSAWNMYAVLCLGICQARQHACCAVLWIFSSCVQMAGRVCCRFSFGFRFCTSRHLCLGQPHHTAVLFATANLGSLLFLQNVVQSSSNKHSYCLPYDRGPMTAYVIQLPATRSVSRQ
jgi:hypothetical protein